MALVARSLGQAEASVVAEHQFYERRAVLVCHAVLS
eukprot:CAMPEP_0181170286 /NCGR_PEP_ID=MMETSP1096-20121128/1279_1 /TAXON_ID=156174 ORGANISM="Chrysochromulina ericina, Strain CCMP281" /NCGR_SAMPLE_ID=MMETSP1096 /ASSEMBLY_ACC=CAM_ASM_000453 /LENGTH=35 /DNA_ID= /DNA_START= /DNA_END= /DNA_ORIENTATION=